MSEFSRQFDVDLIMICGASLEINQSAPDKVMNLCSRWKANNFLLYFHFLLSFIFHFLCVFVVVVDHYGNGQNAFICVQQNQCRINPQHLNIHTQSFFFSLSSFSKHLNLSSTAAHVCVLPAKKDTICFFLFTGTLLIYISNGKRASSFEERRKKKSTIN